MNICIARRGALARYDDGILTDYSAMIRMWSAFDRSIDSFNRQCGLRPRQVRANQNNSGPASRKRER